MSTRIVSLVLLAFFIPYATGCTVHSRKEMPPSELSSETTEKIIEAIYPSGKVISFDEQGGWYDHVKGAVVGRTTGGELVEIPVEDLLSVRIERVNVPLTIVASVGLAAVVAGLSLAIAVALKESCPFVYSFDGEKYVFDAEPLGGAICEGLERTDCSRLEHLRPVDGMYRLMLRNEVEETQHIDEMKLVVFDHPAAWRLVPDYFGNFHVVQSPTGASRAVDERGNDLRTFVEASDGIAWQSLIPTDRSDVRGALRHEITFEFPKPSDATSASLIVNSGTALWGSNMIREMLQLRGDGVDEWYQAVGTGGPALKELMAFNAREEMYVLKFYLREGDAWTFHGMIPGGGPLVTEDLVIPLDVSRVAGDTLALRVNPPVGFWTIDHMAIEWGDHRATEPHVVSLSRAMDHHGNDVTETLAEKDGEAYVMPQVGDWSTLEFEAPPQPDGTVRSVFLKTHGFYEIHTDKTQPEQTALIRDLIKTDGKIIEYSLDLYREWYAKLAERTRRR